MKRAILLAAFATVASLASAAPLIPTITGWDFNFGAFNAPGPPEWSANAGAPDTLTFVPNEAHTEVTAVWPMWPNPPVFPIFNAAGAFGGDFIMEAAFHGQDAPYVGPGGTINVSLTGSGHLMLMGAIPALGIPYSPLWILDMPNVSLYGYANQPAYVLEGAGTVVGGVIPEREQLIGRGGVMRGHLDFPEHPDGWIPRLYDPLMDLEGRQFRADFSGETGLGYPTPEPAAFLPLALGVLLVLRRKR
ncbi:MAG: hypothetical protein U0S12_10835 [Fimbriimonadales bacterium]